MMAPVPEVTNKNFVDVIERHNLAVNQVRAFEIYTLNAGLVDEWQQFQKSNLGLSRSLDTFSLQALLQNNDIDVAIDSARQSFPDDKVMDLVLIADYIAPKYPDRAYSLLNEASGAMPLAYERLKEIYGQRAAPWVKQHFEMALSLGYNKIGKEKDAEKWLQQLKQDSPENEQALTQFRYLTFPLRIPRYLNIKTSFPPEQLLQINDRIQPYLPKLQITFYTSSLLQDLINAQIADGQITQARVNIEFLDKTARQKIVLAKNIIDFNDALDVAKLWKKIGDQKSCDSILRAILNAPQILVPQPKMSVSDLKIQRIRMFIDLGFVDESLRFFYSLPVEGKEPPQSILTELPYAIAIAHPNQFPYGLLKTDSPFEETPTLSEFVRGLTSALFQTPSEQVFEIDSNGDNI
ncbi:MAG: hypothetical protein ABI210_00010 [Abditibacteriaceae bacterium]